LCRKAKQTGRIEKLIFEKNDTIDIKSVAKIKTELDEKSVLVDLVQSLDTQEEIKPDENEWKFFFLQRKRQGESSSRRWQADVTEACREENLELERAEYRLLGQSESERERMIKSVRSSKINFLDRLTKTRNMLKAAKNLE